MGRVTAIEVGLGNLLDTFGLSGDNDCLDGKMAASPVAMVATSKNHQNTLVETAKIDPQNLVTTGTSIPLLATFKNNKII